MKGWEQIVLILFLFERRETMTILIVILCILLAAAIVYILWSKSDFKYTLEFKQEYIEIERRYGQRMSELLNDSIENNKKMHNEYLALFALYEESDNDLEEVLRELKKLEFQNKMLSELSVTHFKSWKDIEKKYERAQKSINRMLRFRPEPKRDHSTVIRTGPHDHPYYVSHEKFLEDIKCEIPPFLTKDYVSIDDYKKEGYIS